LILKKLVFYLLLNIRNTQTLKTYILIAMSSLFLSKPIKKKIIQEGQNSFVYKFLNKKLRFAAGGMQGWRRRMEDAHIAFLNMGSNKTTHLFGVFDGHCGKEVSQFVKAHFFPELIANKGFNDNLKDALVDTFLKMDELMLEPSGKLELRRYTKLAHEENLSFENYLDIYRDIAMTTGCTSCVVAIDEKNKKIYCANAGDSRAIIYRKGVAYPLSIDHQPVKTTFKCKGGRIRDGKDQSTILLILGSRVIGDLRCKVDNDILADGEVVTACPDVTIENLQDISFIVIANHGILDCISNEDICDFVGEKLKDGLSLTDIVEKTIDQCFPRHSQPDHGKL
jgi:protein phosphatase 1G